VSTALPWGKLDFVTDQGDTPPTVFVLFGASGDLAARLVLPAFFRLAQEKLLPAQWQLIGSGRRQLSDDDFRDHVHEKLTEFGPKPDDGPREAWDEFASRLHFAGNGFTADDPGELVDKVAQAEQELGDGDPSSVQRVHYLGLPPTTFQAYTEALDAHGLVERSRVVYEKPFGTSLESFRALDEAVHRVYDESVIYRIDHFLGKEATQQLRALRFANGLFGSSWDRHHVAAVQIDVPEALGLEGRASFYEETGAFRDMVVTHLAQILGFVAMEAPESLDAGHLRDAKAAAFAALRPFTRDDAVYGQYAGYRDEEGVDPGSDTETFVALRAWVDDARWDGVPFLLRTGKAMAEGRRTVTLTLRDPGPRIFPGGDGRPNEVVFELSRDPQIAVTVRVKAPGPTSAVADAALTLDVERALGAHGLEAYERLLHDVMMGDHLLFTRADEVERLWECATPLLAEPPEVLPYERGTWGPGAAEALAEPIGWRLPEARR
jgi:glucose-6-phosphate 1-dehydrogenase